MVTRMKESDEMKISNEMEIEKVSNTPEVQDDGTISVLGVEWTHKSRIYTSDDTEYSYVAIGYIVDSDYTFEWNCRHLHKTEEKAEKCLERNDQKYHFTEALVAVFRGKKGERPDPGLLDRNGRIQFSLR